MSGCVKLTKFLYRLLEYTAIHPVLPLLYKTWYLP
ncbi:MAG: hypothetical protein JWR18_3705 [Segetibacter sp.]|nr:hypothetical protein [Segetibacter sp.]